MEKAITLLLLIVAVIHLLPVSGVISGARLEALYDVAVQGNDLEILMRHRAVLFGLLGSFFVHAAFKPEMQPLAFIAAAISIASFFWLAFAVGDYNASVRKVVIADVIAAVSLGGAVILYWLKDRA